MPLAAITGLAVGGWIGHEGTKNILKYFSGVRWKSYGIDQFKLSFPAPPEHKRDYLTVSENVPQMQRDTYWSVASDKLVYSIQTSTIPQETDISDPQEYLERVVNGMLSSQASSKLISSEYSYCEGYPCIDAHIQLDSSYSRSRTVLVGRAVYILMVVGGTRNYNDTEYNNFLNTFEIDTEGKKA